MARGEEGGVRVTPGQRQRGVQTDIQADRQTQTTRQVHRHRQTGLIRISGRWQVEETDGERGVEGGARATPGQRQRSRQTDNQVDRETTK